MSRLGKKPIIVPAGVEIKIDGQKVSVRGPKGELSRVFRDEISFVLKDGLIEISPRIDTRLSRKLWGTYVSLLKNMIKGTVEGYSKKLILEGIGFKAQPEGRDLVLSLGFSHLVKFPSPDGISFQVEKNAITVSGVDKEKVGETAARLRVLKKPDPYKGKGFRYDGEIIRRKAGKKAAGTTA
ncbi:50S ribosomal protein L6 [Candidatus Giovannonibacteria bacterium RIFCSPHIGHO2_12_44_12]|uniref:Large ribosomal subunit protein uL6 n=6 Tax=Candidatus Giovannoniibacteriota TaxID=1752738 RepID=A0A1F5X1A5_9BACT|nr:MAG: 50S ribosomal protein L6 [Candidatus Giovannonibacteria bacterium GW2011_GWC2_44_8]KKU05188.1 MAG: 50S ribosomal protein L6 [Candidatus Giovannonibacteria bacterium GW2011_GWA2_45_21]OGF73775.1 MAG: 50S ribosomal protein L6 [Candidatus Giovannonibacteria bacterium RIFCSPHIGHO2_02_43_16]OGF81633.1 MAG: 50S ribosomal protein L6 [Candidatus Giovannonibacteria bacterium RIFCSPHIGHO2_12_44_12]OGF84910.1 MAG: 50S ribosomal protein L6 [Candidatus Giovannonibacteria bacterium RIFCSPLOWO2_02_44_